MGCGSSKDAKDTNAENNKKQQEAQPQTVAQQVTVQSADSSTNDNVKKIPPGPPVKLSRAQELALQKREEEKAEEERKKKLMQAKLADGPAVRTTRATEMARDSHASTKGLSGTKGAIIPNGSTSFDSELPPMDIRTFSDADFVDHKVGKMLGKGSFGSSYECTLKDGTLCCVKVIEFGGVADPTEVANLRSEIKLMKRLAHPHIVQYYGCLEDSSNKTISIFMELVTGGTLTQYLRQYHKVPRDLMRKWVKQMLLGVKYLHDSGIVHRDIKGANILMTADGVVRLADFGCSKSIDETCSKTRGCSTMVGTPYWMAPEILKSQPYGPKADIWSVACTIVEMLTGSPPWPEMPNMWAAVYKIANSNGPPPGIPKDLPKNLGRFLDRCFERNPSFRASADELLQHPYLTEVTG